LNTHMMRLPRMIEADPRYAGIIRVLTTNNRLLWQGGEIEVPVVSLGTDLAAALRKACTAGSVVRGLEGTGRRLAIEEKGLVEADRKSRDNRGIRVSRLLVLSDDGSERFYRAVESLLRKHGPRVLAVRLEADAAMLGELLYGPGRIARLLMIEHKSAVSEVMLAMAGTGAAE